MQSKHKLFFFILTVILFISTGVLWFNVKNQKYVPGRFSEHDKAVNQALVLFQEAKKTNIDLSKGPCLSNALLEGWVADIVHSPRQDLDDLPENQCSAFREGRAKHFVELDLEGNAVRVK